MEELLNSSAQKLTVRRTLRHASLVLFHLLAFIYFFPQNASARTLDCTREFERTYYAGKSPKNEIQFGFEIEVDLKDASRILEYYRLPNYTEAQWLEISLDERVTLVRNAHPTALTKGKSEEFLVGNSNLRSDLAPTVQAEAEGRLEISGSAPSNSIADVEERTSWIFQNIGPGSLQGHVSFKSDPALTVGAAIYVKHDSEIAVLDSLRRSHRRATQWDSPIPNTVLDHHSLAPVNRRTVEDTALKLGKKKILPVEKDLSTKNIFGIAYRPDLYGFQRAGFEVRNCHVNISCMTGKMQSLARQLEDGFSGFKQINDEVYLDESVHEKWSPIARQFLDSIQEHTSRRDTGIIRAGTPTAHRYSLPLVDWRRHPYIESLEDADRARAVGAIEREAARYIEAVNSLAKQDLPIERKFEELNRVIAQWSQNSGLADRLKQGQQRLLGDFQQPRVRDLRPESATSSRLPAAGNKKSLLTPKNTETVGAWYSPKDLKRFANAAIKNLEEFGFSDEDVLLLDKLEGPDLTVLLKAVAQDPTIANGLRILMDEFPIETLAEIANPSQLVQKIAGMRVDAAREFIGIAKTTGLRTSKDTPEGGLFFRNLTETSTETLDALLRASLRRGGTDPLRHLLTTPFFHGVPGDFSSSKMADALIDLVGNDGQKRTSAISTIISKFSETSTARLSSQDEFLTYQAILAKMSDSVRPIDEKNYLVKIDGSDYRVNLERKKRQIKVEKVSGNALAKKEKEAEATAKVIASKQSMRLADLAIIDTIRNSPDSVFILSARGIHHQGLVIGDTVYSISGSKGVSKLPLSTWISRWGDSTLVQLGSTAKQKADLLENMESQLGVEACFAIKAAPGKVNCTNMVSRAVEAVGLVNFPNEFVRSDSKGQIEYLTQNAASIPQVVRVIDRKSPNISLSLPTVAGIMVGGYAAVIGGTIGLVHGYFAALEYIPPTWNDSAADRTTREVLYSNDSRHLFALCEEHCAESKCGWSSIESTRECLVKGISAANIKEYRSSLQRGVQRLIQKEEREREARRKEMEKFWNSRLPKEGEGTPSPNPKPKISE